MEHDNEIKAYGDYARAKDTEVRSDKLLEMAECMEDGACRFTFLRKNARVETYGTRCYSLIRGSDQKAAADFEKGVLDYAKDGRFLYYDLLERTWMIFDAANLIAAFTNRTEIDFLAKHLIRAMRDVDSRAGKLSLLCGADLRMRTEMCVLKVEDIFANGCRRNVYGTRNAFIVGEMNPDCLDNMALKELRAQSAEGRFGCFNIATKAWENIPATSIESIEEYDE